MGRGQLAVITAVLAAVLLTAPLLTDDVSAESVTIYGYVSDISNEEGNTPIQGVEVTLLDSTYNVLATSSTDENGRFTFTYEDTDNASFLEFSYSGYTIRTVPSTSMSLTDNNIVQFSIAQLTPDEEGNYALSGNGYSAYAIGMAATTGVLYGYVQGTDGGDPFYVEGAVVTAVSDPGRSYSTTTNSDGYFEMTVDYGTYTLTVSCSGFQTSESVTAYTGTPTFVTLDENTSGFLWNLDTPHTMMLFGLILVGVVVLLTFILIRKSRMPDSEIVVVDDMPEESVDVDDRIEHP
ncbi:MAG: carboxypeptidase regulatory-like domain-containing protein [Thermoplasmata archaeon]|nr:carboxypeptidase regulatory-like domain-containing protein [Thermoplasmata archaeon]